MKTWVQIEGIDPSFHLSLTFFYLKDNENNLHGFHDQIQVIHTNHMSIDQSPQSILASTPKNRYPDIVWATFCV